ncbi:MAG: hypothetical protein MUP30_08265 [Deltaproteobacteria bacterium]|nr:hypothetical protein [Deltaproteobacteria bacterium]
MMRTNLGKTYRSKRWAKRWARGRPVRKVKGGWRIGKARARQHAKTLSAARKRRKR